jgi:hypothetical protein
MTSQSHVSRSKFSNSSRFSTQKSRNVVRCTDRWGYDQVRLHFVICQVAFPLTAFSCFDLKTIVQLQERRLRDVNAPVTKDTGHSDKQNGRVTAQATRHSCDSTPLGTDCLQATAGIQRSIHENRHNRSIVTDTQFSLDPAKCSGSTAIISHFITRFAKESGIIPRDVSALQHFYINPLAPEFYI